MLTKTKQRVLATLGLGAGRAAPPPDIHAIADGVLVTGRSVWAWYLVPTQNTDLESETARDGDLDQVVKVASEALADLDCHIKVMWGTHTGAEFLAGAGKMYRAGNWPRWAAERAARIDALALPKRCVLIGAEVATRENVAGGKAAAAIGLTGRSVKDADLARYTGLARRTGNRLAGARLRVTLAPAETIAWMAGRELYRGAGDAPPPGTIQGAALATLTSGRVEPYADHCRIIDGSGKVAAYVAVLAMPTFPDQMEFPGEADWLRAVSDIGFTDDQGNDLPVVVDASVRLRALSRGEALKAVDRTRSTAKEQRQSAEKSSTGSTSQEFEETEALMEQVKVNIRHDAVTLVEDHPRLIVRAAAYGELISYCDAVTAHYAGLGIGVVIGYDEQRDLWLEQLPGDQLRVPDLGHTREGTAFWGSAFWGGSETGDDTGPVTGFFTGSTPGLYRNDITAGSARGDATVTVYVGRAGRGKTTSMFQDELEAGFMGAFVQHLDFKSEAGGLVDVAQEYQLPSAVISYSAEQSGAADLFQSMITKDAILPVTRQLTLVAPHHLKANAEAAILAAANRVASQADPSAWAVIQDLLADQDRYRRELGGALEQIAYTPLGSAIAGQPSGTAAGGVRPGVWVTQFPGLTLPSITADESKWDLSQRVSMACVRGFTAHAVSLAGRQDLRGLRKVVAVPEVHRLTRTDDGQEFLDSMARMGRALNVALVLDTQDATGLSAIEGVVEQITTVYGFQLVSEAQQDALAALLGMRPDQQSRELIRAVGLDHNKEIRKGHPLVRDRRDRIATVQIDLPAQAVIDALSTTPASEYNAEEVVA
jgi:AAA-like domain